jgi:hypothetical protein
MNKAILAVLSAALIILLGCGDEEQGFPNPLQIEILTAEEEESSSQGSVTGQIIFADEEEQIRAYPLSSNEYVTFQGSSKRVPGKDLVVFVDFPSNSATYVMEDGYFRITDLEPGTHELILMPTTDVIVEGETNTPAEGNFAEIDFPTSRWTVTVEPCKNTTTGALAVPIPDLEWKSGEAGEEIVVPQEPEPPVVPTKPPTKPQVKPLAKPPVRLANVENGHLWLFDDVNGDEVPDSSKNGLSGNIVGDPELVPGLSGKALKFDGVDDGVHIPDSDFINVTNGPWPNRTIMAVFNCADVSKKDKQTIFEEGGRTRGLVIYVFDGELYVGGWNRAEYDWNPGTWISASIGSNRWYAVALVIRDGGDAEEPDKFEMWLDGQLIGRESGGQIYNHSNDNAIGYTKENAVFHDDDGSGDGWYFEGLIDEVWVLNEALTAGDLRPARLSVEPTGKLAAGWGTIKAQH